jgi:asparagine synthase (glutamine-hydrolysing)
VCGLIGSRIWSKSKFEAVRKITQETLNTLRHRGPDAMGLIFIEQYGLILGHTRLSIFDPSPTGNQPMASQSGHAQLIYNGAIYNYIELKKDLEAKGISFRGTSDTEVLIECLNEYGTEALPKLRGMFAFAFWDDREKILLLARDRVGKKPLYYCQTKEGFFFASEINTVKGRVNSYQCGGVKVYHSG